MFKRAQLVVLLCLWFLASGAQWDFAQVFGWARMVASYARVMPLAAAVKKTFSGEMCGVCVAVHDAKQDADPAGPQPGKTEGKLLAALAPALEFFVGSVPPVVWPTGDPSVVSLARSAPPLPPPRA